MPVLVGPTASGKTAVSVRIAESLPVEIVSADSRQVYRFMDVGTAKPDSVQLDSVTHHFVSAVDPDAEFNAGIFGVEGRTILRLIR